MSLRSTRQRRSSTNSNSNNNSSSLFSSSPSTTAMSVDEPTANRSNRGQIQETRPIPSSNTSATAPGSSVPPVSTSQRTYARSFVPSSPLSNNDLPRYSSIGVRDQTAELASFTFSSLVAARPLDREHPDSTSFRQSPHSDFTSHRSSTPPAVQRHSDTPPPQLPDTIQEISEPPTPSDSPPNAFRDGLPSSDTSHKSGLSDMFRNESRRATTKPALKPSEHEVVENSGASPPDIVVETADEQTPLISRSKSVASKPDEQTQDEEAFLERRRQVDPGGYQPRRRNRNTMMKLLAEAGHNGSYVLHVITHPKSWDRRTIWQRGVVEPVGMLPCVFLGLLLNVLDALSYGMILFPLGEPVFAKTGPDGISMFYLSCIVSQVVYSGGGSIFRGAVGSEMIEVVPFFHKMAYLIIARTGTENPKVVLATTITAFAMSSVVTGIVFFFLGALKLGSIVSFFPRHILVGCVGGVGFFLFKTGLEVSSRLGTIEFNLDSAERLFTKEEVPLWIIPLVLAVTLLFSQHFIKSSFFVPTFFIMVTVVFYIVLTAVGSFNVELGRAHGWIFPAVESNVPFNHFYTYYDFKAVDWSALAATIPSMFALTFFGVLHVPINVPALGIAAEEDEVNLNRELVAHGFSNAISGFVGSIQNYLAYVNSAMFIENGGNSRLAGFLLAAATAAVWFAGPGVIGYVPVMVVGSLIYYIGIVLLEEALYDTWGRMTKLEYSTIVAIVLVMGVYDFVAGVLVGIVLACLNFVVQTSRKSAIRATYSGEIAESTVRRHPIQRRFLHDVGYQIYVTKLAGFLFFGSIVSVEKQSRALIEEEAFNQEPIRFLIFDLANVNGVDYSAAEAFGRMERVLGRRRVRMVISGVQQESDVGKSLRNVGLWSEESSVQYFETLNGALEFCENELLQSFYRHRDALENSSDEPQPQSQSQPQMQENGHSNTKTETTPPVTVDSSTLDAEQQQLSLAASPRQRYLDQAASTALKSPSNRNRNGTARSSTSMTTFASTSKKYSNFKQPLPLLLQTFSEVSDKNEDFWFRSLPYFKRQEYTHGSVLFSRGQKPDAFYILESGILSAYYITPVGSYHESIVEGTTCGELPFFSNTLRTATVSAEKDCVVWRLSGEDWEKMKREWSEGAQELLECALRLTKERWEAVVGYVLTTAG